MKTLRSRLVVSHTLPIIVVLPLVTLILAYLLETEILLENLTQELVEEATSTAEVATDQTEIWSDADQAQRFLQGYNAFLESDIRLFDANGQLIASNNPRQPCSDRTAA